MIVDIPDNHPYRGYFATIMEKLREEPLEMHDEANGYALLSRQASNLLPPHKLSFATGVICLAIHRWLEGVPAFEAGEKAQLDSESIYHELSGFIPDAVRETLNHPEWRHVVIPMPQSRSRF